jgi:hypothetical protein
MQTVGQTAVPTPKHPLRALTTSELSAYKAELRDEIAHVPLAAAVAGFLRRLLDDVLLEEDERRRIRENM